MGICIGVPKEIKPMEGRVALTPAAADELVQAGHRVVIQRAAGEGSGYPDAHYSYVGAEVLADAEAVYGAANVVVKVKEPLAPELPLLRQDHLLFSYLHLAANRELLAGLCEVGLTAVAFETVAETVGGRITLPLLQPMSEIAGRIAIQVGAHLLHTPQGGRGVLLGGVVGVERAEVVVLGAGHAGGAAARLAAAMGAKVTIFDRDPVPMSLLQQIPNIETRYANATDVDAAVRNADLLVGAVLLPGAEAPRLVSRDQVLAMNNGSVIVDIAVDQGGCIETTRATTYDKPIYTEAGVTHFCVTNMPGAVPRSASQALSGAMLPYLKRLLAEDWSEDAALAAGVNVAKGKVIHPALLG